VIAVKTARAPLYVCVAFLALGTTVSHADSSSTSSWFPWTGKSAAKSHKSSYGTAKKGSSIGKMSSGVVQNLSAGPKKLVTGTKSMFTPASSRKPPKTQYAKPSKPSLWQRLFGPEERQQPRTVGEWMKQPRVQP
jgi:hypothetical protein